MTEDIIKVGAVAARCHCIMCSNCLLLNEILYLGGSEISREKALESKCRCVLCGGLLVEDN